MKKTLIIAIITIVVIIIVLSATLIITNAKKEADENRIKLSEENNNIIAENIIKEFYTDMRDEDFSSATELFDKDEFNRILGESGANLPEDEFENFLKEVYEDLKLFYFYSINNIKRINGLEDFKNNTNIEISESEYKSLFGNNKIYIGNVDINGTNAVDIFLITDNNKLAGTIRLINYYNDIKKIDSILSDAIEENEDIKLYPIKDILDLALYGVLVGMADSRCGE